MAKIGVVAEGSHDYFMLEPIIRQELIARGHTSVTFERLQPTQDATGYYPDGGWTRVVAWCLDNAKDAFESVFAPQLNDTPSPDAVLIHLDGDAAEHLVPHTSVPIPDPLSVSDRVKFIIGAIEDWLDTSPEYRTRLIVAAPVLHTEAWMNASVSGIQGPYEVGDAKSPFRARRDRNVHSSLASYYSACGEAALESVELISQRCVSYRLFEHEITKSVVAAPT